MALVLWIRLLPLSLLSTDALAERLVQSNIRDRLIKHLPQQSLPSQQRLRAEKLASQWIARNPVLYTTLKTTATQRIKSQLSYIGKDGKAYVYLGDTDSYLWLRNARNHLLTGTPCDAILNGECRDTYGNAPVGSRMIYNRSLHTSAIVGLHRLISHFKPDYPLPASAFLVPVIMGVIGVLPAFLIGQRLAGNTGGLFSAVLISLFPTYLLRSIGSDNDVWNIVLALFMSWAVIGALDSKGLRRVTLYGTLAGVFAALHAATWRGWFFTYIIVMFSLIGHILFLCLSHVVRERTYRIWQATEIQRAVRVAAIFYVATGLATTLTGVEEAYFTIPHNVVESVLGSTSGGSPDGTNWRDYWPDVLKTVSELSRPNLGVVISALGGHLFFFGALLGLFLLILPKTAWRRWHVVALVCGTAFYAFLLATGGEWGQVTTVTLLAVPLISVRLVRSFDRETSGDTSLGGAFIVMTWFLAAIYIAFGGLRFLLFIGPPFGIACAVAISRLHGWLSALGHNMSRLPQWLVQVMLLPVLGLLLVQPIQRGYATGRDYIPAMNDAWWDTLSKINRESQPDAILNIWWDYGYWAKYVAQRRVSSDGGSLTTHVPHWLGKALIAPTARESIGILRMLNCGSDATPLPEGLQGAYGKLRAQRHNPVTAYAMTAQLVILDKSETRSYLAQHGFSETEQATIIHSTHCSPPESFLIISHRQLVTTRAWTYLGLWDPRKVHFVKRTRPVPRTEALNDLVEHLGYPREAFTSLHRQDHFTPAPQGYLKPQWFPCRSQSEQTMRHCGIGVAPDQAGKILDAFVYDTSTPKNARLLVRSVTGQALPTHLRQGTPAVMVMAGARRREEIVFPAPTYPNIAVLVDIPNDRILVGSPHLIRSTMTHLMYLGGRYTMHFKKFDDQTAFSGERIVTWKIDWQGHGS